MNIRVGLMDILTNLEGLPDHFHMTGLPLMKGSQMLLDVKG
jgi:hypothetical protein